MKIKCLAHTGDDWELAVTLEAVEGGAAYVVPDETPDSQFGTNLLEPLHSQDLGRLVEPREGIKFLDTLLKFYGNAYYKFEPA